MSAKTALTRSVDRKVMSHVQREEGDWIVHTLMLADCEVPFQYKRKKRYRSLTGTRVNIDYYPQTKTIAGIPFEFMKVVRLRVA